MGSRGTNRRLRDGSPGRPAVGKQTSQWIESLQAEMSEIKTQLEQKELKKKSQPVNFKQQPRGRGSNTARNSALSQDRSTGVLQLVRPKQAHPKFSSSNGTSTETRKGGRSPMRTAREASSQGASPMSRNSVAIAGILTNDDGGTGGSSSNGAGRGGRRQGRAPGRDAGLAAVVDADAAGTGTTLAMKPSTSSSSREPKQVKARTLTLSPERKQSRSLSASDALEVMYPRSLSPEWGPLPCWPGAMPKHNRQGAGWAHRTAKQGTDTKESRMPLYHTTEPWKRTRNRVQSSVWSRERSCRTSPMQWGNWGNYVVESRMDGKTNVVPVRRLHREAAIARSISDSAPPSPSQSPSPSSRGRKAKESDIAPVLKSDLRGAGQRAPPPIALPAQKVSSVLEEWYRTKQEQITGVGGDVNGLRQLKDWEKATGPEFQTAGRKKAGWSFPGEKRQASWATRGVDFQTEVATQSMTRVAARRNQLQQARRTRSLEQDRFTAAVGAIAEADAQAAQSSARLRRMSANEQRSLSAQPRALEDTAGAPQLEIPLTLAEEPAARPTAYAPMTSRSSGPERRSSWPDLATAVEPMSARWEGVVTPAAVTPTSESRPLPAAADRE